MENYNIEKRDETMKRLWKRPEGVFGIITGIGLFGAIGYGIYKALPFLISLASNMITLIAEIVVLVILVYILLNKNTWRNFSLIWYQLNRKILGWIVDLDPISILKKGIEEMEENMDIITKKVTELKSIIVDMEAKLKEYKAIFDHDTRKKKQLEEKLRKGGLTENEIFATKNALVNVNNNIVRGNDQIKRQQERLATSEKYYKMMQKLSVYAGYKVDDAKNELRYKEEEFEQAKKSRSAMHSIMSILKGGLSDTIEKEMALANINNTINMSIAEMRQLIDGSNDILTNFDTECGINMDKADELLKMYDEHGFDIFKESDSTYTNQEHMQQALNNRANQPALENAKDAVFVEVETPTNTETNTRQNYFN